MCARAHTCTYLLAYLHLHTTYMYKYANSPPSLFRFACFDLQASPRKQSFGCAWFSLWQRKTLEAVKCGCNLLVITKRDGTLGNSQQGEVRYLQQNAWPYSEMNILDFLMYFAATAPKDQKVLVSRKLQGSVNRCRRAKADTSNRLQGLKLDHHQATKQGAQHRVCVNPWTLFWW